MEIKSEDMEILLHTLGLSTSKEMYRNHFVASPGHHDMPKINRLVAAGLMIQGRTPDFARPNDMVFYATESGKDEALAEDARRRKAAERLRRRPAMPRLRGRDENGRIYEFGLLDILEIDSTFGVSLFEGDIVNIDPATIEAVEDGGAKSFSCDSKILAALESAHKFIDAIMSFYGTNLEVANWHMNGDLEHWDSFFDENMSGDELELLNAAIAMIKEGGAPRKALLGEVRAAVSNIRTFQRNFDGTEYTTPCCMIWQITKILDEMAAKL